MIYDHICVLTTREGAWYIILVVSMSVCLYVCLSDDNFRKHSVYLQVIRVKFVYEGHRVKIKVKVVTEAKRVENSYSRNVKLLSAITHVL